MKFAKVIAEKEYEFTVEDFVRAVSDACVLKKASNDEPSRMLKIAESLNIGSNRNHHKIQGKVFTTQRR